MDWQTILVWAAIIAVPVGLIVVGAWWQLRVTHWVAGRASRIDEEKFPPEVRRRRSCRVAWCKSSRAVPLTSYALCSSSRACTTSS